MDADPLATTVRVERVTEPFSGMPLLRVTGFWRGGDPPRAVEVWYDDQVATRCEFTPAGDHFDFGTQLPVEPNAELVRVVLCDGGRVVYENRLAAIGTEPAPPTPGFAARTLRSITSGEVFSPARWQARFSRAAEKTIELRQRVRSKLLGRKHRPRSPHDAYVANTALTQRLRAAMLEALEGFRHRPTFSILVPVYNVEPRWLKEAIDSVRAQVYPHWELCLADDNSTNPDLLKYLDRLPADPRIKLARRSTNGHICRATNTAAELATGEFVCLLDHDDALAPHALFAVAERLQQHPDADLIYSDEDKIDERGRRYDPQFKPDWSPELLLSYNYVNHFTVIRRAVFEQAGRFRPGFEGSQDHDLLLRVTERTDRVQHVPQILYHWRSLPSSTAAAATVKTYVHTAGRRAVEEALRRRGVDATPAVPPFARKLGLPVLELDGPDDGPRVAVIIHGTADTESSAEALNRAAAGRTEDLLLFLEAGAEPADPRWLSRLVANLQLPGVGAVGGVIRAADGTVIDAGPSLGMHDGIAPAPAFAGLKRDAISYYFYAEVTRNTAAVSGRCLLTRRETFERLGGFDARRFPRSLWDIDYGLRLRAAGLRCVTVGGVELMRSRDAQRSVPPAELLALKRAYGRPADPYHNPNCSERTPWLPNCDGPLSLPAEATRPPVRALVAAHNLNNPEGAPRYLAEIVTGLQDRGAIEPVVFSPLGGPGAGVYHAAGIPVVVGETPESRRFVDGLWTPREYEAAQRAAARLLRDHRPEVVIANTLTTFPLVEAAARAGIPAVWIIHESYSPEHLARIFPPFARKRIEQAFVLAARVVPASHDTAALFAHWTTRGNVRVIHNGLDAKPFDDYLRRVSRAEAERRLPGATPVPWHRSPDRCFESHRSGDRCHTREVSEAPPRKVHIIAVGTVCERKGQHTLVEAAAELARTRTDFACYLVGARDGIPYVEYIRHLVRRHRLESVVHLIPETDDVWAFYRAADVFACTSHMETFSRAVLEAEAFGLPVVSTPCCGVGEQVFWGPNALRFDFGDAAGLAKHLGRLIADEPLRAEMGRQSRAAFDTHLNHHEMLDRYANVILAAARHGPRAGLPFTRADAREARRAA